MEILVSTNGGSSYTSVRKLNPFIDPNDLDRAHKPFSSGGFNRAPVWVLEEIDLSNYAGQIVKIKFDFKTHDELYNGFRGWILDDVEVIDVAVFNSPQNTSSFAAKSFKGHSGSTEEDKSGYLEGASEEFLQIHKNPRTSTENVAPTRN